MNQQLLVREVATGLAVRDDGDGRTLYGPLLPWGVEAKVLDRGRLVVETFEPGALAGTDPARVVLTARHPRDAGELPIGRLVELEERDDAAWMAARVSRTAAGDEVLELARDNVPLGLSTDSASSSGGRAGRLTAAASPEPGPSSTTWPSCARRPTSAPGWWACVVRSWPPPPRRSCPWPAAMGKGHGGHGGLKNAGTGFGWDAGRGSRRCIACHRSIVYGERCPNCYQQLRDRKRRKPR